MPFYCAYLTKRTNGEREQTSNDNARDELSTLSNIAVAMRALITSTEPLARNFTGLQRQMADNSEKATVNKSVTTNHLGNHSPPGASIYYDEVSDIK